MIDVCRTLFGRKLMDFATSMNADMGTAAKLLEPLSDEAKAIAGPRIAVAQSLSNCVAAARAETVGVTMCSGGCY